MSAGTKTQKQEQADWRAEQDAMSVADAAAVKSDPQRLAAATRAAKRMQVEEKKRAMDAVLRSNALSSLASSKPKAKPKPVAQKKKLVAKKKKPVVKKPARKPKPPARSSKKKR